MLLLCPLRLQPRQSPPAACTCGQADAGWAEAQQQRTRLIEQKSEGLIATRGGKNTDVDCAVSSSGGAVMCLKVPHLCLGADLQHSIVRIRSLQVSDGRSVLTWLQRTSAQEQCMQCGSQAFQQPPNGLLAASSPFAGACCDLQFDKLCHHAILCTTAACCRPT